MNNLGAVLKFKFPDDYAKGKIIVQKDGPGLAPFIAKWAAAGSPPSQQQLDAWEQEYFAAEAIKNTHKVEVDAAKNRVKNVPSGNSPAQLDARLSDLEKIIADMVG